MHENASEHIVCEMAAILSKGRWVNWTNAGLLSTGLLGTNVSEICIGILPFSFERINLKISSYMYGLMDPDAEYKQKKVFYGFDLR